MSLERLDRGRMKQLLAEAGIRLRRSSGQNFLVEDDLCAAIAHAGEIGPEDVVLEIGVGLGVLTRHLVEQAGHVVGVELDARVIEAARRLLGERDDLTLLHMDALERKNALNPEVLATLRERLEGGRALRVVSNLPYNVATSLILLLLSADLPLAGIVAMVQLEAAERFAARQGGEGYGAVSLLCHALAERIEIVRRVPPEVFLPRPKVNSAVIRITPRADRQAGYETLSRVVRGLFNYRRKRVVKAARLAVKATPSLAGLEEAARALTLPHPEARPEDLSLKDFRALGAAVQDHESHRRTP